MIIPQRHDENHACIDCLLYGVQSSHLQVVCSILLIELPHFDKLAVIGAIVGDELCGHCDRLSAVNLEVGAWTIEVVRAQPVRLNVTTILVTNAAETVLAIVTTVNTLT